jgi:hypothetical protein
VEPALHLRLDWESPPADKVELNGDQLTFTTSMSSTGTAYAPDWSVTTWQTLIVDPAAPLTIAEFHRRFGEPLRALATVASDRPDSLTNETMIDPQTGRSYEVWREGPQVAPRPWRPNDGYLFQAHDLPDFAAGIRAWWKLHEQIYPALGVFAQHIEDGNTYSPARLLTVYSALETYCRMRHGSKDLRRMRTYAGVPNAVTGCTNDALDLLGFCRGYFMHFTRPQTRFTPGDADAGAFPSIRRASALMQACLLRDLGLDAASVEARLNAHYANWPIP